MGNYYYNAWGKITGVVNTSGAAITDPANIMNLNPFRYRSYYYDTESGLYYLQTRYYDPETWLYYYGYRYYTPKLGRCLSRDPVDEQGGLLLYGFLGNSGVNNAGLLGRSFWDFVPVISWLKTLIYASPGQNSSDYSSAVAAKTCCELTPGIAESRCKKSMVNELMAYQKQLAYGCLKSKAVDVILVFGGLLIKNPWIIGGMAVDSIIGAGVTVSVSADMKKAADKASTKQCDCGVFGMMSGIFQ